MKRKALFFFFVFALFSGMISAQVVINTDGTQGHASAILDVQSDTLGILIPRMNMTQRDNINAPATGLLVFVTDDNNFYYYDGTGWMNLSGARKINDLIDGKSDNDGTNDYSSVFLGYQAGLNDSGNNNANVSVGYQSMLANTDGYNNTAVGHMALNQNTTGYNNTAIGYMALRQNTTGYNNTAVGESALANNLTGYRNAAVGKFALSSNTSGYRNTAVGYGALSNNISGYWNVGIGYNALQYNETGRENTAVGYESLRNRNGRRNTAIGFKAFYNTTDSISTSTAIGYASTITAHRQIRVGNTSISSIGGYADWTNLSDGRFKVDIKENVPGMALVEKLRPVTYRLDMDALARWFKTPDSLRVPEDETVKAREIQIGFVAQEVEQAARELGFDFHAIDKPKNENDTYGLRYAEFVPVLVKALQEQQNIIRKQRKKITDLKEDFDKKIQTLEQRILSLEKSMKTNTK